MVTVAYTKTTFVDGQEPYVSAEELNKIGRGIEDVERRLDTVEANSKFGINFYYAGLPPANTLTDIVYDLTKLSESKAVMVAAEIRSGTDYYNGTITIPIGLIVNYAGASGLRSFYTIPVKWDTMVTIELYKYTVGSSTYLKIRHVGNINYIRIYALK